MGGFSHYAFGLTWSKTLLHYFPSTSPSTHASLREHCTIIAVCYYMCTYRTLPPLLSDLSKICDQMRSLLEEKQQQLEEIMEKVCVLLILQD